MLHELADWLRPDLARTCPTGVDATLGRIVYMLSRIIALSTLAALTLGISGVAQAQPADYRTYFTFSAPVTLPGVTLPAGRYLFRLADPNGSRKVISVLSADGKTPLAMLHTIPNQLPQAPRDAEIRFMRPRRTFHRPSRPGGIRANRSGMSSSIHGSRRSSLRR